MGTLLLRPSLVKAPGMGFAGIHILAMYEAEALLRSSTAKLGGKERSRTLVIS